MLKLEALFINGIQEGITTIYDEQGFVLAEVPYLNGKKEGLAKEYYQTGELKGEVTFRNDQVYKIKNNAGCLKPILILIFFLIVIIMLID